MKKSFFIAIGVGILFLSFAVFMFKKKKIYTDQPIKIGILLTASHPALDMVVSSFEQELKKQLPAKNIELIVKNGQGLVAHLYTIAQSFAADSQLDAILAVATPAAQAIVNVEKDKPIVAAAITHLASLGQIGENVAGVTDIISPEEQVETVNQLFDATNIGIVYSVAEPNSVYMAEQLYKLLVEKKKNAIKVGITSASDIPAAVSQALRTADLLIITLDNTLASGFRTVATFAQQANKPVVVSDNLLVKEGAVLGCGIDYGMVGKKAAQQMKKILQGIPPAQLASDELLPSSIVINKELFDHFKLTLPVGWEHKVTFISGN